MIVGMNGHFGFSIDLRGHDSITFNDRHLVSPFDFFSHVWIFPIFTFFSWDIFSFFIYRLTVRLVWVFCLFFIIIIIIMILRLVFFSLAVWFVYSVQYFSFLLLLLLWLLWWLFSLVLFLTVALSLILSFPSFLSLSLSHSPSFLSLSHSLSLSLCSCFEITFSLLSEGRGFIFLIHLDIATDLCFKSSSPPSFFLIYIFFCQLISWIYFALSLSLSFFFIYFVWFLSLSLSLSLSLFLPGMLLFSLRFYRTSERTEPSEEAVSVPTL